MEMRFNSAEIAQLIDYSLKNGGGPVKVADQMFVEKVTADGGLFLAHLVEDHLDDGHSETTEPKKKKRKPAIKEYRSVLCVNCNEMFKPKSGRSTYCYKKDCQTARQRAANRRSDTKRREAARVPEPPPQARDPAEPDGGYT